LFELKTSIFNAKSITSHDKRAVVAEQAGGSRKQQQVY
jgi:hypothetical protein